jgi:hypothetical protein
MREYSNAERKLIIELSRMKGMSDGKIFRLAVMGVLGIDRRKQIVIQWGKLMDLEPTEALRIARRAGVVLTTRLPKRENPELLDKDQGTLF